MLPFIPLHFLCTHFWQLVHCIELLPTPLPHTPHGHFTAFCITFCYSSLIITIVLFIFTLMPLFSTLYSAAVRDGGVLYTMCLMLVVSCTLGTKSAIYDCLVSVMVCSVLFCSAWCTDWRACWIVTVAPEHCGRQVNMETTSSCQWHHPVIWDQSEYQLKSARPFVDQHYQQWYNDISILVAAGCIDFIVFSILLKLCIWVCKTACTL